jgi:hypothetical protein
LFPAYEKWERTLSFVVMAVVSISGLKVFAIGLKRSCIVNAWVENTVLCYLYNYDSLCTVCG